MTGQKFKSHKTGSVRKKSKIRSRQGSGKKKNPKNKTKQAADTIELEHWGLKDRGQDRV